jgi:hypothetical protein
MVIFKPLKNDDIETARNTIRKAAYLSIFSERYMTCDFSRVNGV